MQTSATNCLNVIKQPAKHTGMSFLRKEVPVCFPGGQGSDSMPYRSTSSHFEHRHSRTTKRIKT